MAMLKVIILILIISTTFVDARARRKRRQLSGSSYYLTNINPYSSSYNPSTFLTYPSGSFYSAPSYGYPNTGYSGDQQYNNNYYPLGLSPYGPASSYDNQYQFGSNQPYQFQNLGSTYGSGFYSSDPSGLYGYGIAGFNNRYPDWSQGNSNNFYTGGSGIGLDNSNNYWYRSRGNIPFQGRAGDNVQVNPAGLNPPFRANAPVGPNPPIVPNQPVRQNLLGVMRKSALVNAPSE